MSKKDLIFSLLMGLLAGFIGSSIFKYLGTSNIYGVPTGSLVWILPIIYSFGTWLSYFLGRWAPVFRQFGKFAVVGITNFSVDIGILNFLLALSNTTGGVSYGGYKAISVAIATVCSYIFNKYWSFDAGNTHGGAVEFSKFVTIAVIGLLINVLSSSFVVNFIHPIANLDPKTWANAGAIIGSLTALIFSFFGYKLLVFKK